MAFPPRFVQTYGMVPVMQGPAYFVPAAAYNQANAVLSGAPRAFPRKPAPVNEKPPVTTVFVGNIHERCSTELIRSMLQECGNVVSWKRIQGSSGKFQAFGFCEYESPDATLRALRVLSDWPLGDKRLVLKVDDKTREVLRSFVNRRREAAGRAALALPADALPIEDDLAEEDAPFRTALEALIRQEAGELLHIEEGEITRSPTLHGKGGVSGVKRLGLANLDVESMDREKKEYIRDEISRFREAYKEDERDRWNERPRERERNSSAARDNGGGGGGRAAVSRDATPARRSVSRHRSRTRSPRSDRARRAPERERPRRRRSPSSSSSASGGRRRSRSSSVSSRGRFRRAAAAASRSRSPSRSRVRESENEDESKERKRMEKRLREKEVNYQLRLEKWEGRERKAAKKYEKRVEKYREERQEAQREAKKLKEFLEDYVDEKDDAKYYRAGMLFNRRREYEKEREVDARDRQREKDELDELRRQILAEGAPVDADEEARRRLRAQEDALLRKMRAASDSPSPHKALGTWADVDGGVEGAEDVGESSSDDDGGASSSAPSSAASSPPLKPKQKAAPRSPAAAAEAQQTSGGGWRPAGGATPDDPAPQSQPDQGCAVARAQQLLGGGGAGGHASLRGVFGDDVDESSDALTQVVGGQARKPLKPFEITAEDRAATLSAEEKKRLIKQLIEKIPTNKEALFNYPIKWNHVDESLIERRVKPWVTKKIVEYIGEEETTLVDFICQKVNARTSPQQILDDITMVLDDEAEVFVVKMWRLIVYESEAKKVGLVKSD